MNNFANESKAWQWQRALISTSITWIGSVEHYGTLSADTSWISMWSQRRFSTYSVRQPHTQSFLVNVKHVELTAANQTIEPYKLGKKSSKWDQHQALPLMDLHLSWWIDYIYLGAERWVNEVESPQVFLKPKNKGKPGFRNIINTSNQLLITQIVNSSGALGFEKIIALTKTINPLERELKCIF